MKKVVRIIPEELPVIKKEIKLTIKKYERQKGELTSFNGFDNFNQNDLIRFTKETEELIGDNFSTAKRIGITYEEFNNSYIIEFDIDGKKYKASPNQILKAIKDKVVELRLQDKIDKLNDGLECITIWDNFLNNNNFERDMEILYENLGEEIDFTAFLSEVEDEDEDEDDEDVDNEEEKTEE